MIDRYNRYSYLLYARGFAITLGRIDPPVSTWLEKRVGWLWVYHAPNVAMAQATEGDTRVAVLGTAMDLVTSETALDVISRNLVLRLAVSHEDYLDALDWICGRHLLISQDETTTRIQTDATGMRSVFYSSTSTVIASHAHLVASLTDAGPSVFADPAWETKNSVSYLPGLVTVHDGVRQLTPNTELSLESMTVRRIYPRRHLEPLTVDEIVERVHPILERQIVALAARTPLLMSLTAGIDSRTTLALARPVVDQLESFTYQPDFGRFKSKAIVSIDPETAAHIATSVGIRHRVVRLDNDRIDADLREILVANVHHEHIWPLAQWYLNNLSDEILHVRSNLYEIGRCFWRKSRPRELPLTSERMALTHRPSFPNDAYAVSAFDEFVETTGFEVFEGFDPYDLFYWEHRMGRWHSGVVLESDISHDTWVLINARGVLELFLAASLDDRLHASVFHRLIDRSWPTLNTWPFNSPLTQ